MAASVYTLYELVDLSLRTPEVGAVNFNILRVILLKILTELELGHETVKLKLAETSKYELDPSPRKKSELLGELPSSSIDRNVEIRGEEESHLEVKYKSIKESKEKERELGKPSEHKDIGTLLGPDKEEEETSASEKETGSESATESVTSTTEEESGAESGDEETAKESAPVKRKSVVKKPEYPEFASKDTRVSMKFQQVWQMKRMTKKIEAIEEILNSLGKSVEELKKFKDEKIKRRKFEEGEKFQSDYRGSIISREEFENTMDDIGEALCRISTNQKRQADECKATSKSVLKEIGLKASFEDVTKETEPINKKLNILSIATSNIQKLLKDVVYPESCGITRCMACARKSHLPLRCCVIDTKPGIQREKSQSPKSIKKIKQPDEDEELKFTIASLEKLKMSSPKIEQNLNLENSQLDEKHIEKPLFPEYLVKIETLGDVESMSRRFAPLRKLPDIMRRNTVCIPQLHPVDEAVSVSFLGTENSEIVIRRKEIK